MRVMKKHKRVRERGKRIRRSQIRAERGHLSGAIERLEGDCLQNGTIVKDVVDRLCDLVRLSGSPVLLREVQLSATSRSKEVLV